MSFVQLKNYKWIDLYAEDGGIPDLMILIGSFNKLHLLKGCNIRYAICIKDNLHIQLFRQQEEDYEYKIPISKIAVKKWYIKILKKN